MFLILREWRKHLEAKQSSWRKIEVLWRETICQCEKQHYLQHYYVSLELQQTVLSKFKHELMLFAYNSENASAALFIKMVFIHVLILSLELWKVNKHRQLKCEFALKHLSSGDKNQAVLLRLWIIGKDVVNNVTCTFQSFQFKSPQCILRNHDNCFAFIYSCSFLAVGLHLKITKYQDFRWKSSLILSRINKGWFCVLLGLL